MQMLASVPDEHLLIGRALSGCARTGEAFGQTLSLISAECPICGQCRWDNDYIQMLYLIHLYYTLDVSCCIYTTIIVSGVLFNQALRLNSSIRQACKLQQHAPQLSPLMLCSAVP